MSVDLEQPLKLSQFAHAFSKSTDRGTVHAFYHSLRVENAYGDTLAKRVFDRFRQPYTPKKCLAENGSHVDPIIRTFIEQKILIDVDGDQDAKDFSSISKILDGPQHIRQLLLMITNECNFACKYCIITGDIVDLNERQLRMSSATATKAIDLFSRCITKDVQNEKEVIFFGGEPLCNFEAVSDAIVNIRQREELNDFNGSVSITLFTNASLVTDSIAQFFAANDVHVIVSMDGLAEMHDANRVFPNGSGTYDLVEKNYFKLKNAGCNVGLWVLAVPQNVDHLVEVVDYYASALQPTNIGIGLMHPTLREIECSDIAVDRGNNAKIFGALRHAMNRGYYVEHLMRRVRPFAEQRVRVKECPACGHRMLFAPDGSLGRCTSFLPSKTYFTSPPITEAVVKTNPDFNEWNRRSQFSKIGAFTSCSECPAITFCGGGCAHDAHFGVNGNARNGLYSLDVRRCGHFNDILQWLIWELFTVIEPKYCFGNPSTLVVPTHEDRRQLYGTANPVSLDYPLHLYTVFSEAAVSRAEQ